MYYLGSGWFILGPSRVHRGSWKLQQRETSLTFSLSSCNTPYNLHRSHFTPFIFKMTLDLYVYVVLSDGGLFSLQFLDGTFSGVSLHCAVNSFVGTLLVAGETLFIIPAYTRSDRTFSRWPMHAPWTLINTSDGTVCVNIQRWHSSLCGGTRRTCRNAFWKLFCQKWHALPATNCRCDFFWAVFLLLGRSYINCTL